MQPKALLAFWATSPCCWLISSFLSARTLKSFSTGCFRWALLPACRYKWDWLYPSATPCTQFVEVSWAWFSSLSWSHWMTSFHFVSSSAPLSLVSSTKSLRVHSISPSISLIKDVEEHQSHNRPLTDATNCQPPSGHSHWTKPLSTAFWLKPSNQSLIHWIIQPSDPYFSYREIRMWYRTMTMALHKTRQMTSLVSCCYHSIIQGHQIGQSWSPLGEAMLTISDCLLISPVP